MERDRLGTIIREFYNKERKLYERMMFLMIMDNKGKLFGKISIIDLLIIIIIIGAVAGVAYKYTKSKTASPFVKSDDVTIQFFAEEIPSFVADAIKTGTLVKDPVQNTIIGTVKDVKIDKAVSVGTNSNGQMVQTSRPGYSSALITAEVKAIYSDNGVSIGGSDYYIGKQFPELRVGNVNIKAWIYDMKKKG